MKHLRIPNVVRAILAASFCGIGGGAVDSGAAPVLGPAPHAPVIVPANPSSGARKFGLTPAFAVDVTSREQVRQFYNAVYTASDGIAIDSTADITNCVAGANATAFQDAVLLRINWFRAMSGIPAAVTFSSEESAADQSAALMMSANNLLQHTGIAPTWSCFDSTGTNAAADSNLALGVNGPDAITGYIWDYGTGNGQVGHRRWMLYPQTQVMATGDMPAQGAYPAANATWIYDANYGGPRPATTEPYVAWPPPGYVPYPVVFPQWSFALSNADFSTATVTMQSNGVSLRVTVQPYMAGFGEDTLVWYPSNLDPTSATAGFPFNGADAVYAITVSNVLTIAGAKSYSYDVTVFDPALRGAGYVPTSITGTNLPSVNQNNDYTCAPSANPDTTGYQWLVSPLADGSLSDNALNGLANFSISPSPAYPVITNPPVGPGKCFHLTHLEPAPQLLQLTEVLFPSATTALRFRSLLGYATTNEVARVQISTNNGVWEDIFTQTGTGGAGQTAFAAHTLSLSAYAGQITYLRFNYDYTGGAAFFESSANIGWCLENIEITNTSQLFDFTTNATPSRNFTFTPAQAGPWIMEARGVIFNQFGLDWSAARQLTVVSPPVITTQPTNQTLDTGATANWNVGVSGKGPFTYQWQFDGANLWGATSSNLTLANIQASEAGTYGVVVSTPFGTAASSTAELTVLPQQTPVTGTKHLSITRQPKSQTAAIGSTVFLSVSASGEPPLSYQWRRNGTNISDVGNYSGTSNATLVITEAQGSDAGNYSVVVSSSNATVKSAAAMIHLAAAVFVQITGDGTVTPNYNGRLLPLGGTRAMIATPKPGAMFAGWSGDIITNAAVVRFEVESNLSLQATFVPNPFLTARGAYAGLFAPTNEARNQTNSGAFNLSVNASGLFSGQLVIGSDTTRLTGIFNVEGTAQVLSTPPHRNAITTSLQLDFGGQSVTGTVSDGNFTAQLTGQQSVFSSASLATNYEGRYTLIIPGLNDPTIGPFGASYGTVTVSALGQITFAGSLADGTSVSQTSFVSGDGAWPLYLPLYRGGGSLWSWNYFGDKSITSSTNASWINITHAAKLALYPAGFTNDAVSIIGSLYNPRATPLLGFGAGNVTLEGGEVPAVTNQVTVSSNGIITLAASSEDTNKLTLTVNKNTGAVHGTFANPSNPRQTIKINGVLLQNQSSAAGYFAGTNQSGAFILTP